MPVVLRAQRRRLLWVVFAVIVVIVLVSLWANLWTEKLWYDSVGFSTVFRTELVTKTSMFVVGWLVVAGSVYSSMAIAYARRPIYAPTTAELDSMDRYREVLEPFRKVSFVAVPVIFGLFAGSACSGQWQLLLLWLNRQPFGTKDAEFHKDIGFYVFTLPWFQFIVGFLTLAIVLGFIAAMVTHYIYGGISLQGHGPRTTGTARVHLSLIAGALVLVRAVAYWLSRYSLTTSNSNLITGIDYTGQHAVLPAKEILAVAAVLCAVLFVATIWTRTWRLPLIGVVMLLVCAIVLGGIYPAIVQNFKVKPSEQALQSPYISRNISATRQAYGLTDVKTSNYNPTTKTAQGQLRKDASTVPGIRLLDPMVVSPTFQQLQGRVNYYQFSDALDVDRYQIGGKSVDTVIGVRGLNLNGIPAGQRNWVNDHSVYTHGFGVVAAYGNQRSDSGEPVFFEQGIPPVGKLGTFQPRIYFGESLSSYSIVGGPKSGPQREFDYPDSATGGEMKTTYAGSGGVSIGSFTRKLAYAIKYRQYNFLFSDVINKESRLLYDRTPIDRVKKVAPWLTVDGDPYPVVVNGDVKWIVDGYTTSARYPYSELQSLGAATTDSLTTGTSNVHSINQGQVNYIRNSVKATVDAYTGKVTLYAWDPTDPVLKAWEHAFGGTVQPMSKMSSALMSHIRYPEDLFKVQRELLTKYHVTDPASFFQGNDFWQVPADPTKSSGEQQPPYYLSLAMPGQSKPAFSLTTTFIPTGQRQNLAAFMSVDSDPGSTPGKKAADYGQFRVLEMPRSTTVKGPGQFQNDINSSNAKSSSFPQTLAQFLTLNSQSGARIEYGNLLTLPVGGGLLYVEPIYVKANGATSFPLERAVVVEFGNKLAWGATLDGALDDLFGGNSGASAGDAGVTPKGGSSPTPSPSPSSGKSSSKGTSAELDQALADVEKYYQDGQAALKKGDWTAYGRAQAELQKAIEGAVKLEGGNANSPSTPSNSSTASPSGK
ncbi:UPF0182 family protein [Leekyejoonella antrihumi]|uniref:UPF0182 protein FGL98_14420 n=1 Tax=Leekyejoonella antrihumi TaxID=1660198 RepID=A0A563DYL2_9MICO|nr:UPF0182 family protein [Leekyejoonella antrihumi]TWP35307.1 UPF0182 family protein [Leekyejoonella antrihumi]